MTQRPLLSIIVPIYKVERYLNQCVDSVLSQNLNDYELILVDDGSPDRCPEICDEYKQKYPQVKVIHKINGGLSDARNAGVEIASGKYITFLDSDDFWDRNDVIENLQDFDLQYPDTDVFLTDFILYFDGSNKRIIPNNIEKSKIDNNNKLDVLNFLFYELGDMKMSASQKIIKREFLEGLEFEKGVLSEDIDWTLKLYPKVNSFVALGKPFYAYRQMRAGSITATSSSKHVDSLLSIIERHRRIIPDLNVSDEEKNIYMGYLAYQLSIAISLLVKVPKQNQKRTIQRIKDNLDLFNCTLNFKTAKVKKLLKFMNIPMTSRFLDLFVKVRNIIRK